MQKSRYGNTEVVEEFLRYPFNGPVKYDFDYSGTFSKLSLVDKNYVDGLVKPHKRLMGGGLEWYNLGEGMTFSTSKLYYTFTGENLSISAGSPNLIFSNGDSMDRIDAVVINEGGTLSIVKGEPGTPPPLPTISESQILVQYAHIQAGATKIGSSETIYANNGQWNVTPYQLSGSQYGSYDANFGGDDYESGSCVQLGTDYRTGVKFTRPLSGLTASMFGSLSMRIKFTSIVPDNKSLFVQIQGTANGAAVFGNTLNLMTYGLQRDVVNSWQHVVVPTSKFGNNMSLIQSMTLRMAGGASGSNTNFRTDYILLQRGWNFDGYMGEPDATGGVGNSGASSVTGGVIGPAEDGSYSDGVFTDFSPSTPIGTAVDRFNELFLALVPSAAPSLLAGDWSGSRTGGVNGKLSFDDSNPISGSTYFGANTAPSPVNVDGLWSSSGKRLSVYAASNTNDIGGTLAANTPLHTGVPTPAYAAYSFSDATVGNLTLNINGVIVSTASLSSTNNAINNTSTNTISGFVLSAAAFSKFPTGSPFVTSTPAFISRTGTWVVKANDVRIRNGYNYIIAEHKSTNPAFTRTLTRFEFIQDHNTDATSYVSSSITGYTLSGSKYLSGIEYYTGGFLNYNATIANLYRNTYSPDSNAISYNDISNTGNAGTNPIITVSRIDSLVNGAGNELRNTVLSTDFNSGSPLTFNIISSGKRRLNDTLGISVNTKRTLQGNTTGGAQSITNVFLDNVTASSNNSTTEGFDDENFRLKGEGVGLSYSLISNITTNNTTSGPWDSSQSLNDTNTYHNTGLQVYNSSLIYPTTNFSGIGTSISSNPNYGITNRNYSTTTGVRTYIRYFYNATTYGSFKITINGSGGTFVAKTTPITGTNNIWVEMKLPGTSTPTTGWLDCYNAYNETLPGPWDDGRGAWKSSGGAGKAFGTIWGLGIGSRNNSTSGGYVVIKITVAQGFTGNFTGLTFAWG
jgi:hypothetical protein